MGENQRLLDAPSAASGEGDDPEVIGHELQQLSEGGTCDVPSVRIANFDLDAELTLPSVTSPSWTIPLSLSNPVYRQERLSNME
jgi:hypothetical protein